MQNAFLSCNVKLIELLKCSFKISWSWFQFFSWLTVIIWFVQLGINFSQVCRKCSCEVAEEKKKYDKSMIIAAQRKSRMATPIGTPGGGGLGNVPYGQPMPQPYQPVPQYGQLNPQTLMGAPAPRQGSEFR